MPSDAPATISDEDLARLRAMLAPPEDWFTASLGPGGAVVPVPCAPPAGYGDIHVNLNSNVLAALLARLDCAERAVAHLYARSRVTGPISPDEVSVSAIVRSFHEAPPPAPEAPESGTR
jgi:hypothetical protein